MRKFLVLVFVVAVTSCSYAASTKVNLCDVKIGSHTAVTPYSRADKDWWQPRHKAIVERVKQGNVDLLMIGDSITHGWEISGKQMWDKYYAPRNAVNMGFSGDSTQHVLWRLQNGEIENIKPKLAVLMIGTNNTPDPNASVKQIAEGVKTILCQLQTKLPETKILVLAIFPRGSYEQRKDKTAEGTPNPLWAKNNQINKLIAKFADNKNIFFIDINKKFVNSKGILTREIMPDLLHPKEKGYKIWAETMEPAIAKLMGEKVK